MPLEAVVTSIRIEIGARKGPRQLCSTLRLGFGAIWTLQRALTREMRRDTTKGASRLGESSAALHDVTRLPTPISWCA
jgi:hypothetical protein